MSKEKKTSKGVNGLIMGAVIGGAIGSVIGMKIKPENLESGKKKKSLFKKLFHRKKKDKIQNIEDLVIQNEELKKIPHE